MAAFSNEDEEEYSGLPWAESMWMDGDSLAPPCQADTSTVDAIVTACRLVPGDVLFDLGCGDGRICLAAAAREPRLSAACGVEIEADLCERFRAAIAKRGRAVACGGGGDGDGGGGDGGDAAPVVPPESCSSSCASSSSPPPHSGGDDGGAVEVEVECIEDDLLAPAALAAWSERATVIVLYLLPEAISTLRPTLLACLARGARVVCNTYAPSARDHIGSIDPDHIQSVDG